MNKEEIAKCVAVLKRKNSRKAERERAAKNLFNKFHGPVKFFIQRKLYNNSMAVDADDIVSVAFAKAFEKMPLFDGNRIAFSTWIFNIAKNTLIDHMRPLEKSRFVRHSDMEFYLCNDFEDTVFDLTGGIPNGIDLLILSENKQQVNSMIGAIESKCQRKAVDLFYRKQLHYKEIVKKMGVPIGTVKTLIYRGCQSMKAVA